MRAALAQINPVVGDIEGNARRIRDWIGKAAEAGADLAIFPELALCGYPPRDLLDREGFAERNREALAALAAACDRTAALVGFVDAGSGGRLRNAAALLDGGEIRHVQAKCLLPTYDVFDEERYFEPGGKIHPVDFRGRKVGITICEDMWSVGDPIFRRPYERRPVEELAGQGAEFILNLSASPFVAGKGRARWERIREIVRTTGRPFVLVNPVGGNDDLLFDGDSLALDANGGMLGRGGFFEEDLVVVDLDGSGDLAEPVWPDRTEQIARGLTVGIRDYLDKCGFERGLVGLSGGIDSAVTCALAVRALGPDRVTGVSMPSRFSSEGSLADAKSLAVALGIRHETIPIEPAHAAFLEMLAPVFGDRPSDVTEENLQARIRAALLMALSNKFGWVLLSTGNKSELAVGYTTLYGDLAGGLAVLGDVFKTDVYRVGRFLNKESAAIPESTFTKPPSAELRPDQRDEDSLPPYDLLDRILGRYVEEVRSEGTLRAEGFDPEVVAKVIRMVDRAEYKRRQAPPVLKVSPRSFGIGWRMPIAGPTMPPPISR